MTLGSQGRLIGSRTPRIDGYEKVTGRAKYTGDLRVANMLYGRIVMSMIPHGHVRRVDSTKALATPGVATVITCKDGKLRWLAGDRHRTRYALTDEPKFAGDVVAAVAAKTRLVAKEAAELVEVEYEELPVLLNYRDALRADAFRIWPEGNIQKHFQYSRGDLTKGFQHADRIFEDTYTSARSHSMPLEAAVSLAWWDGDHLTVAAATQAISTCRESLAHDLGLPMNKVRVLTLFKGGGFGNKNYDMNYDLIAALLARRAHRPVLLEYTRREDFANVHGRWATTQHFRVGVKQDGRLTALQLTNYCEIGGYGRHSRDYLYGPREHYRCPNLAIEAIPVYTNTPATGNMRAPQGVQGCFGVETLLDQVAHELRVNPVEFKLMNRVRKADGENEFTSYALDECIRVGADAIGWRERWRPAGQGPTVDGRRRGLGMAMTAWHAWVGPGAAIIKVNSDGTASLIVGVTDIGTGAKSALAMIAADTLGVPLRNITVIWGDTDVCPFSIGESGSRTTSFTGGAVQAAALDAKQQLLAYFSKFLGARPEDLDIADGRIFSKGAPDGAIPLTDVGPTVGPNLASPLGVAEGKLPDVIIGRASTDPKLPEGYDRASFAAHFVEVEVDPETGVTSVTRYIAVHDSGLIVNRLLAESQVQGGVMMGLGMALIEELVTDEHRGMLLNGDMFGYKVLDELNAPPVEAIFVDSKDPYGPKSLGEVTSVPVPAAVNNAIFNAVGARVRAMPMTPERVLAAMKSSKL